MNFEEYIVEKLRDEPLFQKAFVHKSYKNKRLHHLTNETLEMIGDKALDLVLYKYHFTSSEEKIPKKVLDRIRQDKTSKKGLAKVFDFLDLNNHTDLFDRNQKINDKIKHNIVESLAGAIFLVESHEMAEKLLLEFILYPKLS